MRVFFTPQVNSNDTISYQFEGDTITVFFKDMTDTFDFSGLPDGVIATETIETNLPFNPLMSAEQKESVLYITLLNFISEEASEFEKFPNWIEV